MTIYLIEFETVNPTGKGRCCYTREGEPFTPKANVPERCWEKEREVMTVPWTRLHILRQWEASGAQYIRNVKCFQMQNEPDWKEQSV